MANLTAADVVDRVRRHFGCQFDDGIGPEWAALTEFSLRPGAGDRRMDLLLVRTWPGRPKGHERIAVEVKVSKADFRQELANPSKRARFEAVTHRFYFAAPVGLITPDELPAGCGLLEASDRGIRRTVEAARTDAEPIPDGAFVEAFRRAGRSEARIRMAAAGTEDPAARVVQLEKDLAAATAARQRVDLALRREKDRVRAIVGHFNAVMDAPCVCGQGLVRAEERAGRYSTQRFTHRDEVTCPHPYPDGEQMALRVEAAATGGTT